jgi:hypothetical protein
MTRLPPFSLLIKIFAQNSCHIVLLLPFCGFVYRVISTSSCTVIGIFQPVRHFIAIAIQSSVRVACVIFVKMTTVALKLIFNCLFSLLYDSIHSPSMWWWRLMNYYLNLVSCFSFVSFSRSFAFEQKWFCSIRGNCPTNQRGKRVCSICVYLMLLLLLFIITLLI